MLRLMLLQRSFRGSFIQIQSTRTMNCRGQRRRHRVVVLVRNGIILVLMAADTTQCQPEHGTPDSHHHIIELVVADTFNCLVRNLSRIWPGDKKASCGGSVDIIGQKEVSCHLHFDEFVIRHIVVQGANDPVAVVISPWTKSVELITTTFGIACRIQPVAGPSFAISRIGHQFINNCFKRLGRIVSKKGGHLFRCGRQTDQVEGRSTDQLFFVFTFTGF